jgi:D-alanyl-D-alanine carboxypeptidase
MIEQIKPLGYYKVTNIYRSQEDQQAIWNRRVNSYLLAGYSKTAAEEEVGKSVCIPGTSEHQLGLAVDIDGVPAVHGWLAEHSWEYGFIVRYPEGKSDITGILYEPWHFRYVGVELAKELYDLGLCMEEYMDMLTAQSLSSDT